MLLPSQTCLLSLPLWGRKSGLSTDPFDQPATSHQPCLPGRNPIPAWGAVIVLFQPLPLERQAIGATRFCPIRRSTLLPGDMGRGAVETSGGKNRRSGQHCLQPFTPPHRSATYRNLSNFTPGCHPRHKFFSVETSVVEPCSGSFRSGEDFGTGSETGLRAGGS